MSLDGFGAGEDQSLAAPLGRGGGALHSWMFETRFGRAMIGADGGTTGLDHVLASRTGTGVGAEIMGRGRFGPQRGPWPDPDDGWRGWWGEEPPFHTPVYVLTHHPRPSLAEDLVAHAHVVLVPIVLGHGSRLWEGLEGLEERYALETIASPSGVTHLLFTRRRPEG